MVAFSVSGCLMKEILGGVRWRSKVCRILSPLRPPLVRPSRFRQACNGSRPSRLLKNRERLANRIFILVGEMLQAMVHETS
jgi:hypothetical protein